MLSSCGTEDSTPGVLRNIALSTAACVAPAQTSYHRSCRLHLLFICLPLLHAIGGACDAFMRCALTEVMPGRGARAYHIPSLSCNAKYKLWKMMHFCPSQKLTCGHHAASLSM